MLIVVKLRTILNLRKSKIKVMNELMREGKCHSIRITYFETKKFFLTFFFPIYNHLPPPPFGFSITFHILLFFSIYISKKTQTGHFITTPFL